MQVVFNLQAVMSSQTLLNAKVCRWIVERTFGISLNLIQKNLTRQLPRSKGCVTVYRYFFLFGTADCGLRTADCGLRPADCGLRTADCGLRTADCGLRTADCGLRTPDCGRRLQFVHRRLRTVDWGLRTVEFGYRLWNLGCVIRTADCVTADCGLRDWATDKCLWIADSQLQTEYKTPPQL